MAGSMAPESSLDAVLAELAALEDPRAREVNEKHGDDHGVNLSKLRAVAKRLKIQQDLSRELWSTGDTAARLLSLLICRPKDFGKNELDAMLRHEPRFHAFARSEPEHAAAARDELRRDGEAREHVAAGSAGGDHHRRVHTAKPLNTCRFS